mmetsp:Transcript_34225/g.52495  ORF Transcript_34225/g.52495 Transcript_34225/m.52495 type:complete len:88 (-) Transcript_34225:2045-2308(-)|eukprot:CAMPEP_0170509182 /NCGR_PEP_ID=MMETSP0208-20121228/64658_1 /TAXON_ID=197538 /ORGANISM="Strombidium inclinatum, Strain S3" /LENGTH=87 /DNA_ID=CAMNT_0010792473 /DNA_START=273 /DNA_END=536 /DNA_ORIENTATION=-
MCFVLVENSLIDHGVQQQHLVNQEKIAHFLKLAQEHQQEVPKKAKSGSHLDQIAHLQKLAQTQIEKEDRTTSLQASIKAEGGGDHLT